MVFPLSILLNPSLPRFPIGVNSMAEKQLIVDKIIEKKSPTTPIGRGMMKPPQRGHCLGKAPKGADLVFKSGFYLSGSFCSLMYFLIVSSSRPTVLTQ